MINSFGFNSGRDRRRPCDSSAQADTRRCGHWSSTRIAAAKAARLGAVRGSRRSGCCRLPLCCSMSPSRSQRVSSCGRRTMAGTQLFPARPSLNPSLVEESPTRYRFQDANLGRPWKTNSPIHLHPSLRQSRDECEHGGFVTGGSPIFFGETRGTRDGH